jgi:predicted RNA-binding Zn ribbon-like protein
MSGDHLALDLAVTIRHDGHGGVADDLAEPAGLTRWVREHAGALGDVFGDASGDGAPNALGAAGVSGTGTAGSTTAPAAGTADPAADPAADSAAGFTADEAARAAAVDVRTAVRALFAHAVLPGPPSSADAGRLPSVRQALDRLNSASGLVPVAPRLDWPEGGAPVAAHTLSRAASQADRLAAALARAAITFLTGPERELLRACPAPRCVRYFIKEHARQEWCKPSCGNRARVARHHARRREEQARQGS